VALGDIFKPAIDALLAKLSALFAPVLTPLNRLWSILKGMFAAIVEVIPATIALVKSVASEVTEWKNFKENISFTGGVVNLQATKDRIQQLIDEGVAAYRSLVDLFTGGFRRVAGKPFEDAQAAAEELESLFEGFGKIGLSDFLAEIGPKLEKAGGKLFEVLAIVQAVAEELLKVVTDLQTLVDFTKDVRQTFESGEGLFLQQKNKRRVVTLDDGSTMKIRLGKLHS
jgi:hypothetical protein